MPSVEFSIGTTPKSAFFALTVSKTARMLPSGMNVDDDPKCLNAARCVNVASGPKHAILRVFSRESEADMISRYSGFSAEFGNGPLLMRFSRSIISCSRLGE